MGASASKNDSVYAKNIDVKLYFSSNNSRLMLRYSHAFYK